MVTVTGWGVVPTHSLVSNRTSGLSPVLLQQKQLAFLAQEAETPEKNPQQSSTQSWMFFLFCWLVEIRGVCEWKRCLLHVNMYNSLPRVGSNPWKLTRKGFQLMIHIYIFFQPLKQGKTRHQLPFLNSLIYKYYPWSWILNDELASWQIYCDS